MMCNSPKVAHQLLSILLVICLLGSFFSFTTIGAQATTRTPVSPNEYWGKKQLATLSNGNAMVYAYEQLATGI